MLRQCGDGSGESRARLALARGRSVGCRDIGTTAAPARRRRAAWGAVQFLVERFQWIAARIRRGAGRARPPRLLWPRLLWRRSRRGAASLHLAIEPVLVEAAQHPQRLPELDLAVLHLAGADQCLKHALNEDLWSRVLRSSRVIGCRLNAGPSKPALPPHGPARLRPGRPCPG